jgi:hypothetical protein
MKTVSRLLVMQFRHQFHCLKRIFKLLLNLKLLMLLLCLILEHQVEEVLLKLEDLALNLLLKDLAHNLLPDLILQQLAVLKIDQDRPLLQLALEMPQDQAVAVAITVLHLDINIRLFN